jgi:hypothetical protein
MKSRRAQRRTRVQFDSNHNSPTRTSISGKSRVRSLRKAKTREELEVLDHKFQLFLKEKQVMERLNKRTVQSYLLFWRVSFLRSEMRPKIRRLHREIVYTNYEPKHPIDGLMRKTTVQPPSPPHVVGKRDRASEAARRAVPAYRAKRSQSRTTDTEPPSEPSFAEPATSDSDSRDELLETTESILHRRRRFLEFAPLLSQITHPISPPHVTLPTPVPEQSPNISAGDDDTSDDLELLNPLTVPKSLGEAPRPFHISDSDEEPDDGSSRSDDSVAEVRSFHEALDSPPVFASSITRLAKDLREAASEVSQTKRKRRLEFEDLQASEHSFFSNLSDL